MIKKKSLYLLGGTMGVGKTTICKEMKNTLPNAVFLDGDWCWDANPFIVNEETKKMVVSNICYLLNNFISCSAYENVIFCWVMDEQSIIDDILSVLNLDNVNLHSISLIASADTIQKRLYKDIIAGIRTKDVIERSLSRIPKYALLDTQKINTDDKSIEQIIKEICGR